MSSRKFVAMPVPESPTVGLVPGAYLINFNVYLSLSIAMARSHSRALVKPMVRPPCLFNMWLNSDHYETPYA
jgi:hypothetical protein